MCHFITATLPPGLCSEPVEAIARNHGRNWLSMTNKYVAQYLDDGEQYFYTTRGHCDCDTSLGSSRYRDKEKARSTRPEPQGDAASWLALIDEVLESTNAKYVGLLLHFYSGDLGDERIAIASVETIPRSELTEDRLRAIHEDVLYRFHT